MTDRTPPAISPRMALGVCAERVVARMPGVALTSGGGRWQTAEGKRRIGGITAVAQGDDRYELELHVVVAWPPEPLPRLAEDLRRRVQIAAKGADLAEHLGAVSVHIQSVSAPHDPETESSS